MIGNTPGTGASPVSQCEYLIQYRFCRHDPHTDTTVTTVGSSTTYEDVRADPESADDGTTGQLRQLSSAQLPQRPIEWTDQVAKELRDVARASREGLKRQAVGLEELHLAVGPAQLLQRE